MVGGHPSSCYDFEDTENHYVGTDGKFPKVYNKDVLPQLAVLRGAENL